MTPHPAENDAPLVRKIRASRPVEGMRLVLHRKAGAGRWFTHRGVRYDVVQGGPGYGYSVHGPTGRVVADGYFTLAEVRAQVRADLDSQEADEADPMHPVTGNCQCACGHGYYPCGPLDTRPIPPGGDQ